MKAAVLHPPFGPGKAASGEHGVVHRPRTVEASHLHIQRFRPDFGKRDDGDAKLQPQLVADPAGRCLEGVLKRLEDLGCSAVESAHPRVAPHHLAVETATAAPSPPNTKGWFLPPSAFMTAEITAAPAMLTAL